MSDDLDELTKAEQRGYANAMEAERKLHEDRIEQLERDNHRWKMECEEFWRAREAKAVEALRVSLEGLNWAKAYLSTGGIDSVTVNHADATVYAVLAELEK